MHKEQYPPRDEIVDMYITQNHSCTEMAAHYHISLSTFYNIVKYYNIKKDRKLSLSLRVKTVQERYGVTNVSSLSTVKQQKAKTCREHYGVDSPLQADTVKARVAATNMDRYGGVAPATDIAVRERMQRTCMERYGVANPSNVQKFKDKRAATNFSKFGVACNLSLPEQQAKIKSTCLEKYGVPYFCMSPKCCGVSHGSFSKHNDTVARLLSASGIAFEREFVLNQYIYDFKIDNILLEINPTYTHSIDIAYHNKCEKLSFDYHHKKSKNAFKHGFVCIQLFDWIDVNIVLLNILNHAYDHCSMVERGVHTYYINIRTAELIDSDDAGNISSVLLQNGFVRVCDDGYDINLTT